MIKWLARRARARYVDFNEKGKLRDPFEEFNENDALEDCKKVIEFMKKLIGD